MKGENFRGNTKCSFRQICNLPECQKRGCIKFDATSFFVDKTAKFNRAISGRQGNSLSDLALQKYYESFMKRSGF